MKAWGIYHLKYLSTKLSEYWKEQSRLLTAITLPSPQAISSTINLAMHWDPHLSSFFIEKYKLYKFCSLMTPGSTPMGGVHGRDSMGATSRADTNAVGTTGVQVNNPNFNEDLFSSYCANQSHSINIHCCIRAGELPVLPSCLVFIVQTSHIVSIYIAVLELENCQSCPILK